MTTLPVDVTMSTFQEAPLLLTGVAPPPFDRNAAASRVGVDGPWRHRMCQVAVVADLRRRRPPMEQVTRIGMDTSKHVFQLHGVNAAETPLLRKRLRRQSG